MRQTLVPLLLSVLCGCVPLMEERIHATSTPGVEEIPDTIAIYPLLSAEMARPHAIEERMHDAVSTSAKEDRMYIVPPVETKLAVTMQSQMLTSLLAAELSRRGFALKEIPVETPEGGYGQEQNVFFVSLASLNQLREKYGFRAVLVGNAYFIPDKENPLDFNVGAAFLRVVDIGTLDVLCHVTLTDTYGGDTLEDVARGFAQVLAQKASLAPAQ